MKDRERATDIVSEVLASFFAYLDFPVASTPWKKVELRYTGFLHNRATLMRFIHIIRFIITRIIVRIFLLSSFLSGLVFFVIFIIVLLPLLGVLSFGTILSGSAVYISRMTIIRFIFVIIVIFKIIGGVYIEIIGTGIGCFVIGL